MRMSQQYTQILVVLTHLNTIKYKVIKLGTKDQCYQCKVSDTIIECHKTEKKKSNNIITKEDPGIIFRLIELSLVW